VPCRPHLTLCLCSQQMTHMIGQSSQLANPLPDLEGHRTSAANACNDNLYCIPSSLGHEVCVFTLWQAGLGGDDHFLQLADFCLTGSESESCMNRTNALHMYLCWIIIDASQLCLPGHMLNARLNLNCQLRNCQVVFLIFLAKSLMANIL